MLFGVFDPVHLPVQPAQEVGNVQSAPFAAEGAGAEGELPALAGLAVEGRSGLFQPAEQIAYPLLPIPPDHHKLVAPVPGGHHPLALTPADDLCHPHQHLVAAQVPAGVVDVLEPV